MQAAARTRSAAINSAATDLTWRPPDPIPVGGGAEPSVPDRPGCWQGPRGLAGTGRSHPPGEPRNSWSDHAGGHGTAAAPGLAAPHRPPSNDVGPLLLAVATEGNHELLRYSQLGNCVAPPELGRTLTRGPLAGGTHCQLHAIRSRGHATRKSAGGDSGELQGSAPGFLRLGDAGFAEGRFMSVTQRHLSTMMTTDSYPASTEHQRSYPGSIRMPRTTVGRVSTTWDESANHD